MKRTADQVERDLHKGIGKKKFLTTVPKTGWEYVSILLLTYIIFIL